jgi:hypothetical protein
MLINKIFYDDKGGDAARLNLSKFVAGLEIRLSLIVEAMVRFSPFSSTRLG